VQYSIRGIEGYLFLIAKTPCGEGHAQDEQEIGKD
jgi:hypothetical protein